MPRAVLDAADAEGPNTQISTGFGCIAYCCLVANR